jgi:FkbM family methyltransferase
LGIVTAILAKRFPKKNVHAFEPNPSTIDTLQRNCNSNQLTNVTIAPEAVAQSDGEVTFEAHPDHRATAKISDSGSHLTKVPCTSLDSYSEENELERIALLKVDVEGHEHSVFEGAQQLLTEQRIGAVYYEVCPALAKQAGFSPKAPSILLRDNGYRLHRLRENGSLVPACVDDVNDVKLENWVALQP